ncbi:hypothetical protein [Microbacterium paludicola]|uniref:hypothetical protein n=1 Tax=Microbacterium paludicola TaxID=300019 RepID=UPI0011AA34E8|nr:hypothetical protein [Microbacterium paludicola]
MTDAPGPARPANGDPATERYAAIMRFPRVAAGVGGVLALVSAGVNLFALEDTSGPLIVVMVGAALVCILALWNVVNFSPTAVGRLRALAQEVGGRFSLWKAGTGGYAGVPFAHGADHERFGVLDYDVAGSHVEVGHLSSQVSGGFKAPTGRRHAYAVIRLPERLPHMILSFGHLSRILGLRIVPDQWHRSQRVDVGFGRGARLFVADGGEHLARTFFTPETVQLLQRVGRSYDIEVRDRNLYLFAGRSVAAGSERRWNEQRAVVETLAASMVASGVWGSVRRQSRGMSFGDVRADVGRGVAIVFGVVAVVIVVLSLIVLNAQGLLG